jgi:hypothetical protein
LEAEGGDLSEIGKYTTITNVPFLKMIHCKRGFFEPDPKLKLAMGLQSAYMSV